MNQQNKTDLIKHQIKQKEAKTNQKNSNKKITRGEFQL